MTRTATAPLATPARWSTEEVSYVSIGAGEFATITPRDHGGWLVTYKSLVLALDGRWIDNSIDYSSDAAEAEITWYGQDTATAAILATI